jgi:pyridinium-3,5-bisthiocarboxylic acid mononucleotide nickel chelatase
MIIGAQLDLGVGFESLDRQLSLLGLQGYELNSRQVMRGGIAATKFDVEVDQRKQPPRKLADISSIINGSSLSDRVKTLSLRVFERLAEAEARIHGTTADKVHFHEVGAVDSIIDTVGAMIGFELLGVERFFCSPLRLGSGFIETEHGRLPVPAPATAELLRGVPVYAGEQEGEFVTPTGAAIVTTLCEAFGAMPQLKVERVGYGAGSRDPKGFPNALRLMMGEIEEGVEAGSLVGGATLAHRDSAVGQIAGPGSKEQTEVCATSETQTKVYATSDEAITVVETNIDDMNPQAYGFVMERAFALGALDVFMVAAQMKKDRPGVLLTVLCKPDAADAIIEMLLIQTTTLGVRYHEAKRRALERMIETIDTEYGCVRIKVARDGARTLHFQPEYDDCARLAIEVNVPLLEVQAAASAAYRDKLKSEQKTNEQDG